MKKVLVVLALVTASAFATGSYRVEDPVTGGTDDILQYDDGNSAWVWPGINYYGTWFDVTDFMPVATGFECNYTEWWFYEHVNFPWDTDQIVVELWTGDADIPITRLASDTITALHNAPVIVNYSIPLSTGANFWMIANTTVYSTKGLPSVIYDEFDNWTGTPHSFHSTDLTVWNPVEEAGYEINAFFRADGVFPVLLETGSWGAIKGSIR
jgi:hypothetical protein